MPVRTTARSGIRGATNTTATGLRATAVAVLAAAALVSCTQGQTDGGLRADPSAPSATASPSADPAENAEQVENADSVENADQVEQAAGEATEEPTAPAEPAPELVRDAFATLQATLNETCTPGAGTAPTSSAGSPRNSRSWTRRCARTRRGPATSSSRWRT